VPCYRCGVRQTDPERGKSPWRRGVLRDHLVLVCPACQQSPDWTGELDRCRGCASVHLIRRLDQLECLDCGLVRDLAPVQPAPASPAPAPAAPASPAPAPASPAPASPAPASPAPASPAPVQAAPASAAPAQAGAPDLAEEVSRALDRVLGRR
jgi:pyruvate/2-oxoglutarate dehydrogenase complex dihydrolipoamide acyltransferase (E2) component